MYVSIRKRVQKYYPENKQMGAKKRDFFLSSKNDKETSGENNSGDDINSTIKRTVRRRESRSPENRRKAVRLQGHNHKRE
jgi:hypothetical protein